MSDAVGFTKDDEALQGSDEKFKSTLKNWHEYAKKHRQLKDWNWYIYDNYYRGNHYIQFNRRTNRLIVLPRPKGQMRVTVNKIYSIARAIRNFATSYRPKWDVISENELKGKMASEALDFYYDHLKIPKKIKGAALHAIKYGVGYFQYGWDDDAYGVDNQRGECFVDIIDPFDLYLDPVGVETGDIQNCRFVDKVMFKPVQEILNNPKYKTLADYEITGDTKRSASEFKDILMQSQYLGESSSGGELKNVLLHETYYKKSVKREGELETEVWVASWIDGHLLRNEKTVYEEYTIIPFSSDDNPNEVYGEGYIKNLVPIVKVLNKLESQVLEYNDLVNKGRYVVDKDSQVNKITNEMGQMIEKMPGSEVVVAPIPGLSSDINAQIQRFNNYLEEISGVTDAFKGAAPAGITAARALESLKAQSANNLQDLKDNLETAISQLGEGILKILSDNVVAPRKLVSKMSDGKISAFNIQGSQDGKGSVMEGQDNGYSTLLLDAQNRVRVTIGSALAYTKEGRIERLKELYQMGTIGPETVLKHYDLSDIPDILRDAAKDQINKAMVANIQSNGIPGMQPQPGMPPQGMPQDMSQQGMPMPQDQQPPQDDWVKLADDEAQAILQGEMVPPTPGAPTEHTAELIKLSQTPDFQNNPDAMTVLYAHIRGEEESQGAPTEDSINQQEVTQ